MLVSQEFAGKPEVRDVLKRLRLLHLKSCMVIDYGSTYSPSELKTVLADELSGLKQLESFCLVAASVEGFDDRDSIIQSWLKSCPSLQEGALLESLRDSSGRYKIVDGQVEATTEPCRFEFLRKFSSLHAATRSHMAQQSPDAM
ncbi:hypothetical protein C8J56DRAFT_1043604 [Mycena floridula]|nr:hypothetical protein C8J56DRAFT_1043604 [Mycena floridula]